MIFDNGSSAELLDSMPRSGTEYYLDDAEKRSITHGDLAVLEAARVSTGTNAMTTYEKDRKLLNYLWRNGHLTPFEMVQVKVKIICPLFVARQWHRHRTMSYNEYSRRYSAGWLEFEQNPDWRMQNKVGNRQGSQEICEPELAAELDKAYTNMLTIAQANYDHFESLGVANELIRRFLPTSTMTMFVASANLRNWFHFLKLRCAPDAQKEIRDIALGIATRILPMIAPWACEEFFKSEGIEDDAASASGRVHSGD